ncbi:hypothetical protein BD310DRAFT_263907 [Dichomitus squalens]|uniref:Uncharacterized protein n=1 Tax=Dichomitus squalens TaxID=114155 RepID=A0A4Q9PH40_9APHY|nr:hypothetical protein BD310DRAFT_263907 [Dichomitus squalens]
MEANGVPPKPSSPPDNSDREVLVITSTSGGGNSIDHSESVVLDSRSRVRRIDIMKNAPVGGFALAYCAHRLYRRYCPRRLPVFTPFKLTELYFFWGSALTLSCYAFVSFADIIRDRDLLTIYLGGDAVAHMTAKQREEISSSSDQILFRGTRGVTFRSALESIRVGMCSVLCNARSFGHISIAISVGMLAHYHDFLTIHRPIRYIHTFSEIELVAPSRTARSEDLGCVGWRGCRYRREAQPTSVGRSPRPPCYI